MGYVRDEIVTNPGSFSIRGGILDLFPVGESLPYRLELFDTEIDSLRTFDPMTQLSLEKYQSLVFGPATELLLSEQQRHEMIHKIKKGLKKAKDDEWIERLESLVDYLEAGIYPSNLDKFYSLSFEDQGFGLIHYLEATARIVFLDDSRIHERYEAAYNHFTESYKDHLEREKAFKDQVSLAFTYPEILKQIENRQVLTIDAIAKRIPDFKVDEMIAVKTMESPLYHGKLEHMIDDLKQWLYKGYKVAIALGRTQSVKTWKRPLEMKKFLFWKVISRDPFRACVISYNKI